MKRLLLASEAQALSRQIWASFPLQARQVFALEQFFKFAFGDDLTSLGIAILKAMDDAGIDGQVANTGKTVSELQVFIRKNQASKLKKYADALGRIVVNSRNGLAGISGDAREEAITHAIVLLHHRGFGPGESFASALSYVQKMLKNKALDKLTSQGRRDKHHQNMTPTETQKFMGDPRSLQREIPKKMWDEAMKEVERDPELQEKGQPRALQFIKGRLMGLSEAEIAEQMEMSVPALRKWFYNLDRLHTLAGIFEEAYLYLTSDPS